MKIFVYLVFFIAILAVAGFGFFSISTPDIPQNVVKVNIDPKDAFQTEQTPAPVVDAAAPAVEPVPAAP